LFNSSFVQVGNVMRFNAFKKQISSGAVHLTKQQSDNI
jgi:hypothetical protein